MSDEENGQTGLLRLLKYGSEHGVKMDPTQLKGDFSKLFVKPVRLEDQPLIVYYEIYIVILPKKNKLRE